MAATPSPNYNDQQLLAADAVFQNRIRQALIKACLSIKSESPTAVAFHRERETFVVSIMHQPDVFKVLFANSIVTNSTVMSDATAAGTVPLTAGNVATQAALVADANIDNAISANFNSYFRTPGN